MSSRPIEANEILYIDENNSQDQVAVTDHHNPTGFCPRFCSKPVMAALSFFALVLLSVVSFVPFWSCLDKHATFLDSYPIRVGAFNIQSFGKKFMSKDKAVAETLKVFQRYDILLLQEVRDTNHTALKDLYNRLIATGDSWSYVSSAPLGRSKHYKEQYAFFYKTLAVRYMGSYQVNDSVDDVYEREPFVVKFEYASLSYKSKQKVVLIALHTKPASAEEELQQLPRTIREVSAMFPGAVGVVAIGDLNAACKYVNKKARENLEIFNSSKFNNLIADTTDTTVSDNTDCAYDRAIAYGDRIDVRNGSVFNFETAFDLNKSVAVEISDHYPIEFLLY